MPYDDGLDRELEKLRSANGRLDTAIAGLIESQKRQSRRTTLLQVALLITSISNLINVLLISSTFTHINNTITTILRMIGK